MPERYKTVIATRSHYRAFGLELSSSIPLQGLQPARPGTGPQVAIDLATRPELNSRWEPDGAELIWQTVIDERPVRMDVGADGTMLVHFGADASFLICTEPTEVLCAPAQHADPAAWQRFLLDSVLTLAALKLGFTALHASAVAYEGGVVGFIGHTGGGKSTLAAELVRRGLRLVCDDILVLQRSAEGVLAHPGPGVMNLDVCTDIHLRRAIGVPLARLGHEDWISVKRPASAAQPLRALFLLERRPGQTTCVEPATASVMTLMSHVVGRPGDSDYQRSRFELFSEVAARVPLLRLRADSALPACELAGLVEEHLPARPIVNA